MPIIFKLSSINTQNIQIFLKSLTFFIFSSTNTRPFQIFLKKKIPKNFGWRKVCIRGHSRFPSCLTELQGAAPPLLDLRPANPADTLGLCLTSHTLACTPLILLLVGTKCQLSTVTCTSSSGRSIFYRTHSLPEFITKCSTVYLYPIHKAKL